MRGSIFLWLLCAALLGPVHGQAQVGQPSDDQLPPNIILEVTEEALNKITGTYRLSALSGHGSSPPLCLMEVPTLFEVCEVVGFFQCPSLSPNEGASPGQPVSQRIPLSACHGADGGTFLIPTAPPVSWRYWISEWRFKVTSDGVLFRATVNTEVDATRNVITDEVPARVAFDPYTNRLRLLIDSFRVVLRWNDPDQTGVGNRTRCQVVSLNVAEKLSFAVPIYDQRLSVSLPRGGTRTINIGIDHVDTEYQPGRVVLKIYLDFS